MKNNSLWLALSLIALGVIILIGVGNLALTLIFAVTLLLPGVGLWYVYQTGQKATAPLAIPAMIIGGTGVILMFQSLTGYWESWAYAWTLYAVFFGYGLMLMGKRLEEPAIIQMGRLFTLIGGVSFAVLGSVFILFTTPLIRYVLAFAALVAGGYLLWKTQEDRQISAKAKRTMPEIVQQIPIELDDEEAA